MIEWRPSSTIAQSRFVQIECAAVATKTINRSILFVLAFALLSDDVQYFRALLQVNLGNFQFLNFYHKNNFLSTDPL